MIVLEKSYRNYVLFVYTYQENELRRWYKKAAKYRAEVCEFLDTENATPTVEDIAVGMVLSEKLRRKTGFPLDCTAFEEAGYGLPEFAVYLNYDARSFCGRWGYDEYEPDLWGLDLDDHEINDIKRTIESLKRKHRHIAYAIIKADVLRPAIAVVD